MLEMNIKAQANTFDYLIESIKSLTRQVDLNQAPLISDHEPRFGELEVRSAPLSQKKHFFASYVEYDNMEIDAEDPYELQAQIDAEIAEASTPLADNLST